MIRPTDAPFGNQLVEPFAVTSMDWAGNISTFSPELLGLKNADYGDFLLGNVNRDALIDLPRRPNFARMLRTSGRASRCAGSAASISACAAGANRSTSSPKTDLYQHRDDLLPSDQDAGDRSRARCARARAAAAGSTPAGAAPRTGVCG